MAGLRSNRLGALAAVAGLTLMAAPGIARADNPVFGSRSERADGSAAVTLGSTLPTDNDFEADLELAARGGTTIESEQLLHPPSRSPGAGSAWAGVTMPGPLPLLTDKASVEARIDPNRDRGTVGATLSRSVPVADGVAVTVRNSYSVMQSLESSSPARILQQEADPTQVITTERSAEIEIAPTGTTIAAGASMSSADNRWHDKVSVEQKIGGGVNVTTTVTGIGTAVTDVGSATPGKSVTLGFKRAW
jgi:hypothetical protein